MEYVDAHCHVDLFPDPRAIVRLADERRVHTIAVTNAPSVFEHTELLARGSHYAHAAAGLHPELVATHGHEASRLWPLIARTRFIGEVGLDYTTSDSHLRGQQRTIFAQILERCASAGDKVITVHSRRAASDTIAAIGPNFPGRVILHWFTGSANELARAISYGFYFSVNPAMLNSKNGRRLVEAMPRERVMTESDGPFVKSGPGTADPGSSNESIAHLARVWRLTPLEAAVIVRDNFLVT